MKVLKYSVLFCVKTKKGQKHKDKIFSVKKDNKKTLSDQIDDYIKKNKNSKISVVSHSLISEVKEENL